MTETTCVIDPADVLDTREPLVAERTARTESGERADARGLLEAAEGWQALALATRGALLSDPELAAAELLPIDVALDLLFPDLDDASRHEALWALDRTGG
jgi:hypothetical protein